MSFFNIFNRAPIEAPAEKTQDDRELERARDELRSKVQLAVVDHNGKRLNERRWRWFRDMVESL